MNSSPGLPRQGGPPRCLSVNCIWKSSRLALKRNCFSTWRRTIYLAEPDDFPTAFGVFFGFVCEHFRAVTVFACAKTRAGARGGGVMDPGFRFAPPRAISPSAPSGRRGSCEHNEKCSRLCTAIPNTVWEGRSAPRYVCCILSPRGPRLPHFEHSKGFPYRL